MPKKRSHYVQTNDTNEKADTCSTGLRFMSRRRIRSDQRHFRIVLRRCSSSGKLYLPRKNDTRSANCIARKCVCSDGNLMEQRLTQRRLFLSSFIHGDVTLSHQNSTVRNSEKWWWQGTGLKVRNATPLPGSVAFILVERIALLAVPRAVRAALRSFELERQLKTAPGDEINGDKPWRTNARALVRLSGR